MKIHTNNMIKDSWKIYSRVTRIQGEEVTLEGYRKWADRSTMSEFAIPYLPEIKNVVPIDSILHYNPLKPTDSYNVILDANRLSDKDKTEIMHQTIVFDKTLTKEDVYKEMKTSFNKLATLFHLVQIENTRYITHRRYLEELGQKFKLQQIPVFDEPNLDIRTRRNIERTVKEYKKVQEVNKVIDTKQDQLIATILAAKKRQGIIK